VAGFAPVPRLPLPFPSILVASRSDLWACFARSAEIARRWGSHLVDAGEAGHLNAESGHGDWPLGLSLLERLIDASCSIGETMSGLARSSAFASSLASPDPMPKAAG
jgi:predicted alpha/beta hydrolase family esterase